MQLSQYVSTIAGDGYRVRPHLVKEIRSPDPEDMGPVHQSINTKVLNRIDMDESNIKRDQEGFRGAFQSTGGTAYCYLSVKCYNPAWLPVTALSEVNDVGDSLED